MRVTKGGGARSGIRMFLADRISVKRGRGGSFDVFAGRHCGKVYGSGNVWEDSLTMTAIRALEVIYGKIEIGLLSEAKRTIGCLIWDSKQM